MRLKAEVKSKKWDNHPEGTFAAVCCDVYETTKENKYYGQVNKFSGEVDERKEITKVVISFLTTEDIEINGEMKPRYVSVWNNKSWHEKSRLRGTVAQWQPSMDVGDVEMDDLIGKTAMITIVHNGDWANVTNISQGMKGLEYPKIPKDFVRHDDKVHEEREVETKDLPF